jgi:predicted HAD superfamily Cof-like phosphohydrolase
MMKCTKEKCNRQFPDGLTSVDGVCFPCRWPGQWTEKDEASYKAKLERAKPQSKK